MLKNLKELESVIYPTVIAFGQERAVKNTNFDSRMALSKSQINMIYSEFREAIKGIAQGNLEEFRDGLMDVTYLLFGCRVIGGLFEDYSNSSFSLNGLPQKVEESIRVPLHGYSYQYARDLGYEGPDKHVIFDHLDHVISDIFAINYLTKVTKSADNELNHVVKGYTFSMLTDKVYFHMARILSYISFIYTLIDGAEYEDDAMIVAQNIASRICKTKEEAAATCDFYNYYSHASTLRVEAFETAPGFFPCRVVTSGSFGDEILTEGKFMKSCRYTKPVFTPATCSLF